MKLYIIPEPCCSSKDGSMFDIFLLEPLLKVILPSEQTRCSSASRKGQVKAHETQPT